MGHKNYNKMSKPAEVETPVVAEEVVETPVQEEIVVEAEAVVEPEVKPEPVKVKTVLGVVVDCNKLRVRKQPNANATIITEIKNGTEVVIDEAKSTVEFFKVTAGNVEGYCMKKFIRVKP